MHAGTLLLTSLSAGFVTTTDSGEAGGRWAGFSETRQGTEVLFGGIFLFSTDFAFTFIGFDRSSLRHGATV